MIPKTHRITVRFSKDEHHQICKNAAMVSMKPSTFIRASALALRIPAPITDRQLMLQLAKIGGNLNQCTRKLNISDFVDKELLIAIDDAIQAIHEVRGMFQK